MKIVRRDNVESDAEPAARAHGLLHRTDAETDLRRQHRPPWPHYFSRTAGETKNIEKGHFNGERLLNVTSEMIAQFFQPPDALQDLGRR